MLDFKEFALKYGKWPLDMFLSHFPLPLLLIEKHPKKNAKKQKSHITAFRTRKICYSDTWKGRKLTSFPAPDCIIRVFDFQDAKERLCMVSVGRSSTNHICLKEDVISKFHAYFKKDPQHNDWSLVDANSENGTFVNGGSVNNPIVLSSGAGIVFGDAYYCTFFYPKEFSNYIKSIMELGYS